MRWRFVFGTSTRGGEPGKTVDVPSSKDQAERIGTGVSLNRLDEVGQRGELLRVRVTELSERLNDLRSVPRDFAAIIEPLAAISEDLSQAQVRIAELEGLLARERDAVGDLRRQIPDLVARTNAISTELLTTRAELQRVEGLLKEGESELEEVRGRWQERSQAASDLDQQLAAEAERVRSLLGETKTLRSEVQTLDQTTARLGRDLAEARERSALSEEEVRRLQLIGEEQAARIVELTARTEVLAEDAGTARERLRTAEARLTEEIAAREKLEFASQAELGAARAEISNLTMRLEAATSRSSSLDRLLGQVRGQLREREEAARIADRAVKDAEAERASHDRRVETLQVELNRSGERWLEAQQARATLDSRCEMLTKALAAKDAALEQALSRAAGLADQAEQLTQRTEAERAELETTIRRLTEQLHHERSERALARGALDIARESRATLQKQYEALKRSGRVADGSTAAAGSGDGASPAETTNVRSFAPPERT